MKIHLAAAVVAVVLPAGAVSGQSVDLRDAPRASAPAPAPAAGRAGANAAETNAALPPKGEIQRFTFDASRVFPGTTRDVAVYVPAQYDGTTPACVHVHQDGIQFNAPDVFDRLIHEGKMPVTIGVFVMPGRVPPAREGAVERFNRSFEYDGLGGGYARFLLDELLPAVEGRTTADGRRIRLSRSGNDRAIAGTSSGAICSFTAAWERPDAFTRVFSAVGTYVGLRGGHVYPTLIRKCEPKPLRVFLQDGSADLDIYGGDWWMANQSMQRALVFAGYEVRHAWGDGGHDTRHATEIFPEAVAWLWHDWPAPVRRGAGSPQLQDILLPGEDWRLVGAGYSRAAGPAANAAGELFFTDVGAGKTYRVTPDWKAEVWVADARTADGQSFAPDGRLVAVGSGDSGIFARDAAGMPATLVAGWRGHDVVVNAAGQAYVTEPGRDAAAPSRIHLLAPGPDGTWSDRVVDAGPEFVTGLCLSPDQTLLHVAAGRSHWVSSFVIRPDGSLDHKQRYSHLHVPDTADDSGAGGMRVDRDGRLWVATRLGLQVCDQVGRVNCIIPTPDGTVTHLAFGGPDFTTVLATCGDKVYVRRVKAAGAANFLPPITPPKPRL